MSYTPNQIQKIFNLNKTFDGTTVGAKTTNMFQFTGTIRLYTFTAINTAWDPTTSMANCQLSILDTAGSTNLSNSATTISGPQGMIVTFSGSNTATAIVLGTANSDGLSASPTNSKLADNNYVDIHAGTSNSFIALNYVVQPTPFGTQPVFDLCYYWQPIIPGSTIFAV